VTCIAEYVWSTWLAARASIASTTTPCDNTGVSFRTWMEETGNWKQPSDNIKKFKLKPVQNIYRNWLWSSKKIWRQSTPLCLGTTNALQYMWIGVENELIFKPIHPNTHEWGWILMYPDKTYELSFQAWTNTLTSNIVDSLLSNHTKYTSAQQVFRPFSPLPRCVQMVEWLIYLDMHFLHTSKGKTEVAREWVIHHIY